MVWQHAATWVPLWPELIPEIVTRLLNTQVPSVHNILPKKAETPPLSPLKVTGRHGTFHAGHVALLGHDSLSA